MQGAILIFYIIFLIIAFAISCIKVCKKEVIKKDENKKPIISTVLKSVSVNERDDLKKIKGIGIKIENLLNSLGIYTYEQIASWNKKDIEKIDSYLKFPGRIERDQWVLQAKKLLEKKSKLQ